MDTAKHLDGRNMNGGKPMNLKRRDCPIKAVIEPLGAGLLAVAFDFGDRRLEYTPSAVTGVQFGEFVCALYTLYCEGSNERFDGHDEWSAREYRTNSEHKIEAITVRIDWDGEGTDMMLEMTKKPDGSTILLRASTDYGKTYREYTVDDRDFCYAVAKACTEAIKQFGFYGYHYSTESQPIDIHQLLFLKAYALGNMEARELTEADAVLDCCKTSFEKEMELLLFDM